jgi:hypothetical protein
VSAATVIVAALLAATTALAIWEQISRALQAKALRRRIMDRRIEEVMRMHP